MLSAGFFLFFIGEAAGQPALLDKTISLPRQNTTLYEALNKISQKADCFFIYDSEAVNSNKNVRLYADKQPLSQVLDNILSPSGLEYRVLGNHILVYRAKQEEPVADKQPQAIPAKDTARNVVIRGHVYDKENKTPIPFATIGIVEENVGTIANSDGFFMLKIPDTLIGTALVVSHLGYMSQRIPVQLIDEQRVDLYLDRRIISIQEVIIRYLDPSLIISQAMRLRKENNSVDPVYLTTFYREGVQKNSKYISYSEAVFKVYKSPYFAGEHADQVKLLKSRKIQDVNPLDTVFLKLKAGVQSALQLDIVKSIPGFLDQTLPIEYKYVFSDLVSYDAKDAYAITFTKKPGLNEAFYTGTVYIEKESFAILGADFEIDPASLDIAAKELVVKKSPGVILKLEQIKYSVSYLQLNGRYYLKHVRCEIKVKTRLRHRLSSDQFTTFLELATCNIDTVDVVKFPKQEIMRPSVVFSDRPYSGNDDFWGNFNIITPEEKLGEALSKIIGKIEEIE